MRLYKKGAVLDKKKGAQKGNKNNQKYTREQVIHKLYKVMDTMGHGAWRNYVAKSEAYKKCGIDRRTLWNWINRTWKDDETIQRLYKDINEQSAFNIIESVMFGHNTPTKATWILNRWYGRNSTYPYQWRRGIF